MVDPAEFGAPDGRYTNTLSPERQQQIANALLKERPPVGRGQYVYYEVKPHTEAANVARTIEAVTFAEFFKGESADSVRELYGPYESQSVFFLAVDTRKKTPVGALRVIRNGSSGFLTLNDLEAPQTEEKGIGGVAPSAVMEQHGIEDLDECWDIGAVAVLPEHRGNKKVSVMLYRAMYKKAMEQDIKHIISIIDKNPYERSMQPLGIPFQPLAGLSEPFRYHGSKLSFAAYGRLDTFKPIMEEYRKSTRGVLVDLLAQQALSRLIKGTKDTEINLLP